MRIGQELDLVLMFGALSTVGHQAQKSSRRTLTEGNKAKPPKASPQDFFPLPSSAFLGLPAVVTWECAVAKRVLSSPSCSLMVWLLTARNTAMGTAAKSTLSS